ncbi:porin family protein [Aquimarina sp. 2201CG14-23]|uniref:porin family protein n=1 Tax=Aquimarina mycalae TaxID=3040073 RepID=UPI0024780555|nr:porin family protein [Aquimarina sp. 2201CG14-23]MDH7445677.1 porin family protein [Aquimarina sp. 2201CG14-23]
MNKTLLLLFVFFTLITSIEAQESRYGIRVGANFSSISSDDITGDLDKSRIGVVVGFLADFALTEKLRLQPEFQYSGQGNKDRDLRVNYLQVPIILKYNITDLFNVQLGPQAGIKIWEWEDNQANIPDFGTFDFAAVAGVGVNITDNFFVDLRYAFGLSNVFDKDGSAIELDGNSRNIQLSVGYRL